jgi:hypothetical protein
MYKDNFWHFPDYSQIEMIGGNEQSPAVQVICISSHLLMLSVDILMAGVPTLLSLALRIL